MILLLRRIRDGEVAGEAPDGTLYRAGRALLVTQLDSADDFWSLASFIRSTPEAVSTEEREAARAGFAELLPDRVSDALRADKPSEGAWVRDIAQQLTGLGEALEADVMDSVVEIQEHADLLEGLEPEEDGGRRGGPIGGDESGLSAGEIDQMFQGLRGE
ncbi:MAG: hypothetical protein H0T50_16180 [Gemmatimonadales bacterium]|nr:hypothetical protein [Gemmatimonadales bacterium]